MVSMKLCKIEKCKRKHLARGLCDMHYRRNRRRGYPGDATLEREMHNLRSSRSYKCWAGMKQRCDNHNNTHFHRYGGRGITYHRDWKLFTNFYRDMGECPPGLTLDRIDNDGNYEPENCRWASRYEQAQNRDTTSITNQTGFRGVRKNGKGFAAQIKHKGKVISAGTYKTPEEAHEAYLNYREHLGK
jgi:hypothetical protein